jgi:hypothetical protein
METVLYIMYIIIYIMVLLIVVVGIPLFIYGIIQLLITLNDPYRDLRKINNEARKHNDSYFGLKRYPP